MLFRHFTLPLAALALLVVFPAGAPAEDRAAPPRERPPGVVMIPAGEEPRLVAGEQGLIVMAREDLDRLVSSAFPEAPERRSASSVIESAQFSASAGASTMRIEGTLNVEGLAPRSWVDVTTRGIAIAEVRVDGTAAAIHTDGERFFVEVPRGTHVVKIAGLVRVAASAGSRRVGLAGGVLKDG